MMGQFLHLETYGRTPKKGAKRHETASGILGEASRRPSSSMHIAIVRQPARLFGADPVDLTEKIGTLSKQARDSAGRRLRPDAGLLVAVVISYPVAWTEIQDAEGQSRYLDWRDRAQKWLLGTFKQALASIVEHADERYPHLHAFLVPSLTDTSQLDWTNVHPGRAAKVASARRLETHVAQDAAYRRAMMALADDFHRDVSSRFAHARVWVRRDRRSRLHHIEIVHLETQIADLVQEHAKMARELSRLRQEAGQHQTQDLQKAQTQVAPPGLVVPPSTASASAQVFSGHPWYGTESESDDSPLPEENDAPAIDEYDDGPDAFVDRDHGDLVEGEDGDNDGQDDFSWQHEDWDPSAGDDPEEH